MIRGTFGKRGIDKKSIFNIENCIKYNIPFGVYLYSYALNLADAVSEANLLLRLVSPYKDKITLGLAIDMEDADGYKQKYGMPTNEMLVDILRCECSIFESQGYTPIIYASKFWFDKKLNSSDIKKYEKWLAWWTDKPNFDTYQYKIWQYSSNGKIDGINGRVDLNIMFSNLEKTNKELLNEDVLTYPEYSHNTLHKLIENGTLKGTNGKIDLSIDSVRLLVILDRNGLFEK